MRSGLCLSRQALKTSSSPCQVRMTQASTARWNSIHTRRSAAVCVDSQAKLCTAKAAAAPAVP